MIRKRLNLNHDSWTKHVRSQGDGKMTALELTELKTITAHLFLKDTFDHFCLIEGEIKTYNTFHIDGKTHREFYDTDDEFPAYSFWEQLRGHCFNVIRGKRTPLGFRFVFTLSPDNIRRLVETTLPSLQPEIIQGLYLNFHFDGTSLTCITGTSFKTFTLNKELEHIWDETVQKFFIKHQIPFEIR